MKEVETIVVKCENGEVKDIAFPPSVPDHFRDGRYDGQPIALLIVHLGKDRWWLSGTPPTTGVFYLQREKS